MIDLHCHILPAVDDGPGFLEESLSMAEIAVKDGIHTIVATPHTLNGIYTNPITEIISRVSALQEVFSENHIKVQLYAGADVHLCPHMPELIERGEAGTINNAKKYMLLELPSQTVPKGVKDEIFALKLNGITAIITHAERNSIIQHDLSVLHELVGMGALSQVTAMSLTGDFGEFVRQSAEILLKHRLVQIIASDAHSPNDRPPILSQAVEHAAGILGNYEEAERMVNEIPSAILSGKPPDISEPAKPNNRSRFFNP